eukprot:gene4395-798_t
MWVCGADPPKAIIMMLGDDYGYANVGFAHGPLKQGNPEMRTPHMDELATGGVVLERHYTFKYCSPTRSSLMSGRLPTHVNQNNVNNDILAGSGVDLRMTMLPQKMKQAGYQTAMIGKSHLGARSLSNLPINRGFDEHFAPGMPLSPRTHQGSSGAVDLWEGHGPSNQSGMYSGYIYAERAVKVIENFAAGAASAAASGDKGPTGLFMYLAWHNTHSPLECPQEWEYPFYYNNSNKERGTYNCMAHILDNGVGNVTAALKAGGLWSSTLIFFSADNGGLSSAQGWVGQFGSNNFPLKGSKVSDFEGGVRAVSFIAGGYLPAAVAGTHHTGYISIADWYATLCGLVGVPAADDVPGLPPIDSIDVWPSITTPNSNSTGRTDIFLSWSCTAASAAVSGCDPNKPSKYNTSGDPTAGQGPGDMALISGNYKIIIGQQQGRGIWFGPVYPNGTNDGKAYPCSEGCLYDIDADPTEHVNLKASRPDVWSAMLQKLLVYGDTVYQTDYKDPDAAQCLNQNQGYSLWHGHNTCVQNTPGYNPSGQGCNASVERGYLGPLCFHSLPPLPPSPPGPSPPTPSPPAPTAPVGSLSPASTNGSCLLSSDAQFGNITLGECSAADHWVTDPNQHDWLMWGPSAEFAKVSEKGLPKDTTIQQICQRGTVFANHVQASTGPTAQGFAVVGPCQDCSGNVVQIVSSLCNGMCLGFLEPKPQPGDVAHLVSCSQDSAWWNVNQSTWAT